jgi:membrane-associated phospholipid phosphatase
MRDFIRLKAWFFVPFVFLLVLSAGMMTLMPKGDLHLSMNEFHSSFFDHFFSLITWMGNGFFILSLWFLLCFFSFRLSAYIITTYAFTGIFVQLLKRLFFNDMLRPAGYFGDPSPLYIVEGIKMLYRHSFPSGHAATAFGLFLCLAMATGKKSLHFLYLVLAVLTAYSRIYLSQHFLMDVAAGALIGAAGSLILYPWFYRHDKKWHHLSLLTWNKK